MTEGGLMVEPTLRNFGERIGALEALMQTILQGQARLEEQMTRRFDKLECRYDERITQLDHELEYHRMEDAETFKKLRYKLIEYFVIAVAAALVTAIVSSR